MGEIFFLVVTTINTRYINLSGEVNLMVAIGESHLRHTVLRHTELRHAVSRHTVLRQMITVSAHEDHGEY